MIVKLGVGVLLALYLAVVVTVVLPGADGMPQAILKGWGDVAYHLNIIETLAAGNLFRFEQPVAAGTPLTYPFFIDWISAGLRKIGVPVFAAFHVPAIVFGMLLFAAFWLLGKRVLGRDLLAIAFVAIALFGGGLGFLWFFQDLTVGAPFSHEYTHLDDRTGGKLSGMDSPQNIVWIVPAISFFSHQRSFISGAALGALILWGIFGGGGMRSRPTKTPSRKAVMRSVTPETEGVRHGGRGFRWRWLAAAGFLPLIHAHTFLSFAMILPVILLFEIREWRRWLPWAAAAFAIALPQALFLLSGRTEGAFFQWWPGWMARGYENVLWFWTKNFGVVFWGWVIVLLWRSVQYLSAPASAFSKFSALAVASVVVFAAANLVKFQPWEFDNNKVFFWWWLMASLLIILAIARIIEWRRTWGIAFLIVFVFLGTLSGFLDVAGRFVRLSQLLFGYYGKEEIAAAQWIRQNTAPTDAFLTGDQANNFVPMLSGRRIYLGFSGWLWTQGREVLIGERQNSIAEFLTTGRIDRLCRDGVRYIVWDDGLSSTYPYARIDKIQHLLEPVFRQDTAYGERVIYRLPCQ